MALGIALAPGQPNNVLNKEFIVSRTSFIAPPPVEAYPYIKVKYLRLSIGTPDEIKVFYPDPDHEWSNDDYDSRDYGGYDDTPDEQDRGPANVTAWFMSPLAELSDITFSELCKELKPVIAGRIILKKADLSAVATLQFTDYDYDPHHEPFTLNQLECFLMYQAELKKDIQWGKIAELYNRSNDQQQDAITLYFSLALDIALHEILSVSVPSIYLPQCLNRSFSPEIHDRDTYFYSDDHDAWLREDVFMAQYSVHLKDIERKVYLLTAAPTFDLALAKGISYVDKSNNIGLSTLEIHNAGKLIATGNITHSASNHASDVIGSERPKISWELESPQQSQKFISEGVDLQRVIDGKTRMTKSNFKKILWASEEALGLQWSKVASLEDDLGL